MPLPLIKQTPFLTTNFLPSAKLHYRVTQPLYVNFSLSCSARLLTTLDPSRGINKHCSSKATKSSLTLQGLSEVSQSYNQAIMSPFCICQSLPGKSCSGDWASNEWNETASEGRLKKESEWTKFFIESFLAMPNNRSVSLMSVGWRTRIQYPVLLQAV